MVNFMKFHGEQRSGKMTTKDILQMKIGAKIKCSELWELIVNSKNGNKEDIIYNTPMQGINWIGDSECPKAVIIKYVEGKHNEEISKTYAFKKRNGEVNKEEIANKVIINQAKYHYPLLYFVKYEENAYGHYSYWKLVGKYSVDKIMEEMVTLKPFVEKAEFKPKAILINEKGEYLT